MTRVVIAAPTVSLRPLSQRRGARLRLISTIRRAKEEPGEEFEEDAEDRIARLEAAARGGRVTAAGAEGEDVSDAAASKRRWKEGEALPEGWEDLSTGQKAWELYAGERGALFWANRIALAAAICIGVGWIFFRFVGPQLGLYELKSTFTS